MTPVAATRQSLKGKRILITSGPTWVAIDPMRVISNRASGELGQKLAETLSQSGVRVTLLQGPVLRTLKTKKVVVKQFCFYQELEALLKKELKKNYDVLIHNAAVSDYQLQKPFKAKLDSNKKVLKLTLVPTKKLIEMIKRLSPKTFLVGFKLEDFKNKKDVVAQAKKLLESTRCDLIVANTLKGGYKAYLLDCQARISSSAHSRSQLVQHLIEALKKEFDNH